MPKVTPELLREMARAEDAKANATDTKSHSHRFIGFLARASALREVADMLEQEAESSAHLVIPHDPNFHCWGK